MTREEQIQKAKNEAFPIPENGGRCLECACGAGGFEWGAWWADEHPYKEDKMRYCIEYINPRFLLLDNGKLNVRHLRVPDEHWAEMAITLILSFGGKIYALYRGNVVDGKLGEWETPTIVEPDDWFSEDWFKAISQPSLPSDLDEAVEKHIGDVLFKLSYDDEDGIEQYVDDSFRAGAEWMKAKMMEGAVEADVITYEDLADGESDEERWFIVMANLPTGQISNHYELKDWELFQIPEKEVADEWDGHTPQEAAERIHKYLLEKQKEPHYTKRNALFDECVENCDLKTVEEVNKRVDDIMNMPELSAFEQALTNFIGYWEDDEERWPSQFVKKHGKHILDMAREELQKEPKSTEWIEDEDKRIREKVIEVLKLNIKEAESQMQASRGVNRTFEVYACNKVITYLEKQKEQKPVDDIIGRAMSYFGAESLLDNANGLSDFEKFTAWLYCEFLRGLPKKLNQEYIKEQTKVILEAAKKELCKMPSSTELIEMWHQEKEVLNEKDFRGDPWRIAYNAFMDGFARGTCVKFEKQKEQNPITESKRLANEVIEYLTKCGYSPVLKDDSKKEHFHIDIPRHKDDFWHSEEYKHCRSVLGEYYMEGDHGGDTYTLYVWREKKEQKPAEWSEEDRNMLNSILLHFNAPFHDMNDVEKNMFTWLQSLPERFNLPPKQEWSEEDEAFLKVAIAVCNRYSHKDIADWLKSLPERFNPQPKQEWSEEEYGRLFDIEHYLDGTLQLSPDRKIACIDFLKSLRPSWKPSENQMKALKRCVDGWTDDGDGALDSLFNDLNKLI